MNRLRRWVIRGVVLGVFLMIAFFGFWWAATAGSDRGSPELAKEWINHLSPFNDPDEAQAADSYILIIRCENGEWLFGRTQPSHGIWYRGGGTVVLKDSNRQIHIFFGHVCTPGRYAISPPNPASLESYYRWLREVGFSEMKIE